MAARNDITVTTKHSYEIAYKFNWRCTDSTCGKTYGRHSKSIDPEKHACGICSGRLIQLDKEGNPIESDSATMRKESEWQIFSREAFRRIKAVRPGLHMTEINRLVADEWKTVKAQRTIKEVQDLSQQLESLDL